MIVRDLRTASWSTPVAVALLAGVLLVIGYRSYRAGRAAEAEASA